MFDWQTSKKRVEAHLIAQAKSLAKSSDSQFKLNHPAESRDSATGNHTELVKRVKKEVQEHYDLAIQRRQKVVG